MVKNLYIDSVDVRGVYGVWIVRGGYDELFSFPSTKSPDVNDWPEHNGLEVDSSIPVLEPWEVSVDFASSGVGANTSGFVQMLASPGYRNFNLPSLGRTFMLRLYETVDYRKYSALDSFRLKFIIDQPVHTGTLSPLDPGVGITQSVWSLNGSRFDLYGIFVRSGRNSLLKPSSIKKQMTRKISTIDGQLYDADQVRFSDKSITLQCCMKAADMGRLWACHILFFDNWTQARERTLSYKGAAYKCYYESCRNARLVCLSQKLCMITFDLNIRITDGQ